MKQKTTRKARTTAQRTQTITEGNVSITVPSVATITKHVPIFYNPLMKFNRDTTLLLLRALNRKGLQLADPLAGSGVRTLRFLKELPASLIEHVYANDFRSDFKKTVKKELKRNKLSSKKLTLANDDATLFLLNSSGFDYIDIDPFGTPNPFLDAAVKRLARDGILAVTATDTSSLCGSHPEACNRKYWAQPQRGPAMHEYGIRILIRKIQLIGIQYEKALTPIFCYSKDHYFRVYLRCEKSKTACDQIFAQHQMVGVVGPLWIGSLGERKLIEQMIALTKDEEMNTFLTLILNELVIGGVGFYSIHELAHELKLPEMLNFEHLMKKITKAGYPVSRTHFNDIALRSLIPKEKLEKIIKN